MRVASVNILIVTLLLAVLPVCIYSQGWHQPGAPIDIKIEELGVAQGLSQGMVHGIAVDLKGYLWIATKDGLNRYDGNHFKVFRHDPQDTNSIASNYIRSIHVDDRGLIWIGTNADGLDLYDPATSKFMHFGQDHNPASTLEMQTVTRIFSAPSGRVLIWDGTGANCNVLDPLPGEKAMNIASWQVKSLRDVYQLPEDITSPGVYNIAGFGKDNALIIVFQQNAFAVYEDHVKKFAPDEKDVSKASDGNNLPIYFMDDQRRLYCISKRTRRLYILDEKANTFQLLMQLPPYFQFGNRMFVDHLDRIWTNSAVTPLFRIDPKQGTCQQIEVTRHYYARTDVPDFGIGCADLHHNLYASTSGHGMIKITSRNDQFTRRFLTNTISVINRVIKNGFTYHLDEIMTEAQRTKLEQKFKDDKILSVSGYAQDADGHLWCVVIPFLLNDHVLIRINPDELTYSRYPVKMCKPSMVEAYVAFMIDRKGEKWIAGECDGDIAKLTRIDTTGAHEGFEFPVKVLQNEHAFITDWYVDPQNKFWIGTKQGLFMFDPALGSWKHYRADDNKTDVLTHNHILSICPDPAAPATYLWIGTDGGGLNRMDILKETFIHYTTKDGLPNNVIYGVQSDAHHNLWLSTNLGLSRFDPRTEDVWSFTVEDGLPGNEFNRTEYARDSKGRLYFGGIEGAVSFDPEAFYNPTDPSQIVINRLKLSNKDIVYSAANSIAKNDEYCLPAPLENLQKLTFPYTERMITLGFSLLDFTNPSGNKYRYKLEGFHEEWIDAGDLNEAVFTNLNPGSYTFLVSGKNSNNVWSDPAKMQVVIRSPWWSSWWFRIFVVLQIAGAVYGFYRYRLQQAMKLQHLRNRIAADLHDEIGSTLSSISLAGTVIRHKLKSNHPEVDGLLHKINHNTQTMMEAMSDIVWAVNTKNDRFDQVLHRMRAFAVEILEPNDIMVHFDSSPNITHLLLDMQQRKNLYLIFKEVIHNAAKYAQCKNVWVTLEYKQGRLSMEVKDDGIGFDLQPVRENAVIEHDVSLQKMGGNGIANMYTRTEELKGKLEVDTSPGNGTRVCLIFSV